MNLNNLKPYIRNTQNLQNVNDFKSGFIQGFVIVMGFYLVFKFFQIIFSAAGTGLNRSIHSQMRSRGGSR